jgi:hypothetical protein
MDKAKKDRLKQGLLLLFVCASVLLVGLIWAEGLAPAAAPTPSYYRGAPPLVPQSTLAPATVPADTPAPLEDSTAEPLLLPGLDDEDA